MGARAAAPLDGRTDPTSSAMCAWIATGSCLNLQYDPHEYSRGALLPRRISTTPNNCAWDWRPRFGVALNLNLLQPLGGSSAYPRLFCGGWIRASTPSLSANTYHQCSRSKH